MMTATSPKPDGSGSGSRVWKKNSPSSRSPSCVRKPVSCLLPFFRCQSTRRNLTWSAMTNAVREYSSSILKLIRSRARSASLCTLSARCGLSRGSKPACC